MNEPEYIEWYDRLIEQAWPHGFPREVEYPRGQIPVTEYLNAQARETPDKPCLIYYGYELSYRELDDLSSRFATFLASRGLKKGDRVAVFLLNCPQFFICFYGILKLGCIHVPVNPMFKQHEYLYEIKDTDPRLIVTLDSLYPMVARTREQTGIRDVVVTRFADFLPSEPTLPLPPVMQPPPQGCPGAIDLTDALGDHGPEYPETEISLDDVATINYTGGTTGMPKGCIHTHWNLLYTVTAFRVNYFRPGEGFVADQTGLLFIPSFWIAGQCGLLLPIVSGGTTVYLTRWDPGTVLQAIERYRIANISGPVDGMVELMEHPDLSRHDLSSLKTTLGFSFIKKLNLEYRRRWEELTGVTMRESSYGMTETHTCDCFTAGMQNDDMDLESTPVFVGLPVPGTRFRIADFVTGELVPLGEQGEIVISTPSLMKGYWNDPRRSAEQIQDGWFHTGDIGIIDEAGYLHYLGRTKEMLKVKGMSVFPVEIENLLGRHPAIEGSGVLGRPDRERGQVPVAFVKLRPERAGAVSPEELVAWCRDNMAVYKVPEIRIVDELPLTDTGKVRKEVLRERHASLFSDGQV